MVSASKQAAVLGATGQIGRAVRSLLDSGWEVLALSRGKRQDGLAAAVEHRAVDRDERGQLTAALREDVDVVIDVVAFTRRHAEQLVSLRGRVGSLIVISSASVYADEQGRTIDEATDGASFPKLPVPVAEIQRTVEPGDRTYSMRKVEMERVLLDQDELPVTVLRPCAVHGPGAQGAREWWVVGRARDRRAYLPLAYAGGTIFHPTSTANLAELARLAAEHPGSRILNCGDPDPPDVRSLVRVVAAAVDHHPAELLLPGAPEGPVGESPWTAPRPFVLDMATAERTLGYKPVTTYGEAVRDTCRWLLEQTAGRPWQETLPQLAAAAEGIFPYQQDDVVLGRLINSLSETVEDMSPAKSGIVSADDDRRQDKQGIAGEAERPGRTEGVAGWSPADGSREARRCALRRVLSRPAGGDPRRLRFVGPAQHANGPSSGAPTRWALEVGPTLPTVSSGGRLDGMPGPIRSGCHQAASAAANGRGT